jgi:hypothetical protein
LSTDFLSWERDMKNEEIARCVAVVMHALFENGDEPARDAAIKLVTNLLQNINTLASPIVQRPPAC